MTEETFTGAQLREALTALDMTQRDFARLMDRSDTTVSLWCNDKEPIPRYAVAYLKQALELKRLKKKGKKSVKESFRLSKKDACNKDAEMR